MEWRNLGQFPSGITLWEPVDVPDDYKDIVIHSFPGWEGVTVSFGLHQIPRFKCVEDAMKFAEDLVANRKIITDKIAAKEARKAKRNKKNADNLADV